MRIGEYQVRIGETEDGGFVADFMGTDLGGDVVVHSSPELERQLMVVKVPGSHAYSGQGQPWHYQPGRFVLFEIEAWIPDGPPVRAEKLMEWPVRWLR